MTIEHFEDFETRTVKSRQLGVGSQRPERLESSVRSRESKPQRAREMTQINRFEDIEAWKKGRELAKGIYTVTAKGDFAKDYSLRDQIRRAAVSIISNIAEGFSRQTDKEFVQFLYMAKGSTSEVQSQLYIAADLGYINQEELTKLYNQADEVGRLIFGLIRYLRNAH